MLNRHIRKEARSRAPEYADYYIKLHGAAAHGLLRAKASRYRLFSYHWLLFWLAAKQARRRSLSRS